MRSKAIAAIFFCVLTVLSSVQIIFDFNYEAKLEKSTAGTSKEAEYCIFIEIEDKTLYLLENDKCIRQYPIASGKSGLPSPLGCWKITEKGDWGEGFGGRWLGLDVPCPTYRFGLL